jgi:hypothetical protein
LGEAEAAVAASALKGLLDQAVVDPAARGTKETKAFREIKEPRDFQARELKAFKGSPGHKGAKVHKGF